MFEKTLNGNPAEVNGSSASFVLIKNNYSICTLEECSVIVVHVRDTANSRQTHDSGETVGISSLEDAQQFPL
jgi:hypothetical protein